LAGNARYCTNFATELLAADGNRGEILTDVKTKAGIVYSLDALLVLGVKAVKITIVYPLLVSSYPQSEKYLEFYKYVCNECRVRGLRILIQITPAFLETFESGLNLKDYYKDLTREIYEKQKLEMAQTVIDQLAPDYLTIENEPSTAQMNTGLDFSVDQYIGEIKFIEKNIRRKNVKIGAGAGNWEDFNYFDRLIKECSMDFIDLHIYPINHSYASNLMFRVDSLAKRYDKKLLVGETWLYKVSYNDLVQKKLTHNEINSRDVYSFWDPLDLAYIASMMKFAVYSKAEFFSFYWMQYFFAKLNYTDAIENLTPSERYAMCNVTASPGILSKKTNQLGNGYNELISKYYCEISNSAEKIHSSVVLSPNPVTDYLELTDLANEDGNFGLTDVSVLNHLGELVIEKKQIDLVGFRLNVINLPGGFYILRIKNIKNNSFVLKFIKK
jgi:hypothetical protein